MNLIYNLCRLDNNIYIYIDISGNSQIYVESSLAHYIICRLSIERRHLKSRHVILRSYAGRSLVCPIFRKEVGNQCHASLTSTITRTCLSKGMPVMKICSTLLLVTLNCFGHPTRACTLHKHTCYEDMPAIIFCTAERFLDNRYSIYSSIKTIPPSPSK